MHAFSSDKYSDEIRSNRFGKNVKHNNNRLYVYGGFLIGLTGYKYSVEYLYSPQGYFGFVLLTLVVINFIKEFRKNRRLISSNK